jgi:hypothetical protein
MIWHLPHPLNPSAISKLDRRHTGRLRNNLLTGEEGQEGMEEEEPYHKKARKPGSL